jgi:hypothetical protein
VFLFPRNGWQQGPNILLLSSLIMFIGFNAAKLYEKLVFFKCVQMKKTFLQRKGKRFLIMRQFEMHPKNVLWKFIEEK